MGTEGRETPQKYVSLGQPRADKNEAQSQDLNQLFPYYPAFYDSVLLKPFSHLIYNNYFITFTFTFSHLADAFVQSDVQGREQSS